MARVNELQQKIWSLRHASHETMMKKLVEALHNEVDKQTTEQPCGMRLLHDILPYYFTTVPRNKLSHGDRYRRYFVVKVERPEYPHVWLYPIGSVARTLHMMGLDNRCSKKELAWKCSANGIRVKSKMNKRDLVKALMSC